MVGCMTVDEPGSRPDPDDAAKIAQAAAISRALRAEERAQRLADQKQHVLGILVPDDTLERLIVLWIKARRQDEGMTRSLKAPDLARQVSLTKRNQPVMALIRAAYRAGIYNTLYPADQEEES